MSAALTPLTLVAAGVLVVSGIAKLRAPHLAVGALGRLGLPADARLARALALAEAALGLTAWAAPAALVDLVMAVAFAGFAVVALRLARQRAACGCFGAAGGPASGVQAGLSVALAGGCAAAGLSRAGGLGWVLAQPPGLALGLGVGTLGAVYAAVLVYTELPAAWSAWSGR